MIKNQISGTSVHFCNMAMSWARVIHGFGKDRKLKRIPAFRDLMGVEAQNKKKKSGISGPSVVFNGLSSLYKTYIHSLKVCTKNPFEIIEGSPTPDSFFFSKSFDCQNENRPTVVLTFDVLIGHVLHLSVLIKKEGLPFV